MRPPLAPLSWPTLSIVNFFNYSYSRGCKVVLFVFLIWISLMTNDAKHFFMCLLTFVYLFLWSIHLYLLNILNELFFLLLNFQYSLCILDTSPSSVRCFANIFSQFVVSLFILLVGSFKERMGLILIKFN